MSEIEDIADGFALWEEHRPQTAEDWLEIANRCLSDPPENPSPLFGALLMAARTIRVQPAVHGWATRSKLDGLLDELTLHDDTGDSFDEGYAKALQDVRDGMDLS